MVEAAKDEGFDIFGFVGSWNNKCGEDMLFLIPRSRVIVIYYPNGNPGVGFLVLVQLCTIERKLDCCIMWS